MNRESESTIITGRLQIFFEDSFWVGIFEHTENGKLSVCKVTFGSEPKDYMVEEFILKNYTKLSFSPSVASDVVVKEHVNPKRMQREAKRQLQNVGIGTKSQQALQLQREASKVMRKERTREEREAEKERRFELKQQKRLQKHKGR